MFLISLVTWSRCWTTTPLTEHLGIPETRYDAEVALPSSEFNRIIRDLKEMGESIRIEATKEGVTFTANGDIGKGAVTLKHNADAKKSLKVDKDKHVIDIDSGEEKGDDEDDDEGSNGDEDGGSKRKKPLFKKDPDEDQSQDATQDSNDADESQDVKPKLNGVQKEKKPKKTKTAAEEDEEDDEEDQQKDEADEEEADDDEEDEEDELPKSKKRKLSKKDAGKPPKNGKAKAKERKSAKDKKEKKEEEEEDLSVSISLQQSVSLTFSIKYLSNFTKATPLAKRLTVCLLIFVDHKNILLTQP